MDRYGWYVGITSLSYTTAENRRESFDSYIKQTSHATIVSIT